MITWRVSQCADTVSVSREDIETSSRLCVLERQLHVHASCDHGHAVVRSDDKMNAQKMYIVFLVAQRCLAINRE